MDSEQELSATISISRKLNLGNYESADLFMSVSNITKDTTAKEVAALLDGPAHESFDLLKVRMIERITQIRPKAKETTS